MLSSRTGGAKRRSPTKTSFSSSGIYGSALYRLQLDEDFKSLRDRSGSIHTSAMGVD